MKLPEWTEERWPRFTMRYNPKKFACQMLVVIVVELAALIVLVAT